MPFAKGQSGNPLGRPKGAAGIAKYIAEQTDDGRELVDRLLELSRDARAPIRERFAATNALIDRAVGRPLNVSEIQLAIDAVGGIAYPPGWSSLPATERAEWLTAYRSRLLAAGGSQ